MSFKTLSIVLSLFVTPLALFWGCGKSGQPVSAISSGVLNVQISSSKSGAQFVGASQNTIYYNVSGTGVSITGSYGPISASGVSGTFSFPVTLKSAISSYNYISIEVADASSGLALAVGAAPLSSTNGANLSIELGPVNKSVYQVTALTNAWLYNFEANTTAGSTIVGADDILCANLSGTAFQFNAPNGINAIAYMGTGPMANFLTVPPANNFEINSSTAKSFLLTGSGALAANYPLALNDVYCVKMYTGGYAWLQVTNVGVFPSTGPSFVFRVNTTQQYCAYEQTTADKEIVNVLSAFSLANATPSSGLAVSGPSNGAATILYTNYSNSSGGWIQGFNVSSAVPQVTVGAVATPNGAFGGGLAVNSSGTTVVKSYPTAGIVVGYQSVGGGSGSYIGSSSNGDAGYNSGTYFSGYAPGGAWIFPYGVAADSNPNSDIFGADIVGTTICNYNVMGFSSPYSIPSFPVTTGTCSAYGIAVTISGGTTFVYVADGGSPSKVLLFNGVGGTQLGTWTTDKVSSGTAFNFASGIALNANGKLVIANMASTFSVVEWNISPNPASPTFVGEWGPTLSSGYGSFSFNASVPIGIAIDNATPPNIFVSDYGNNRTVQFKGL